MMNSQKNLLMALAGMAMAFTAASVPAGTVTPKPAGWLVVVVVDCRVENPPLSELLAAGAGVVLRPDE